VADIARLGEDTSTEAFRRAPAGRAPLAGLRLALLAAACLGAAASAQQWQEPYQVDPVGQVLLPDAIPADARERTVEDGDVIVRGRIGYRAFATVEQPIELAIAGQSVRVAAGEMLAESRVRGGAMEGLGGARAFCLPSYPTPPRAPGTPSGSLSREIQPCFVDQDNDGRLDFALLAGTRRAVDRAPVPLAGLPYRIRADVPIAGAELNVHFYARPLLGPASLALGVILAGTPHRGIESVRIRGADGRMHGFPYDHAVAGGSYPRTLSFGPAQIEILGYDREARRVRLRVVQDFTRTDLEIVLIADRN
jgi:hypothetical protein